MISLKLILFIKVSDFVDDEEEGGVKEEGC